jgi:uncharacterized protein YecE (DUF72 family)
MKFGAADGSHLQAHDFFLPAVKQTVLSGLPALHPKIYIGLPHWGKKEWVGKLYPAKTREKEFLNLYAAHFNSIELNATHYKIYPEENIISWRERVGEKDFKFCPKIYKGVTHFGSLEGKEKMMDEFLKSVNNFQKHIGPMFLQLPEAFSVNRKEELIRFLSSLPVTHKFFVELRHESWFNSAKDLNEIIAALEAHKIGFVISDTIARRDTLHMQLTTPEAFIRFRCTSNEEIDKSRILQWKQQLQIWFKNGLQTCYFFIHLGETPIEFAKHVQTELSDVILTN